ncbi:hypothetical protein [Saccharothrix sp. ALI-22-I]|uniref:hypothetical protein n=1 Tax=Saccharothrix sp. ALI-22-I TaxID=1933778 RepID=UPI00117A80CD|nr:hypothetical protein [Saccharothrix sp. ALI-22-I]
MNYQGMELPQLAAIIDAEVAHADGFQQSAQRWTNAISTLDTALKSLTERTGDLDRAWPDAAGTTLIGRAEESGQAIRSWRDTIQGSGVTTKLGETAAQVRTAHQTIHDALKEWEELKRQLDALSAANSPDGSTLPLIAALKRDMEALRVKGVTAIYDVVRAYKTAEDLFRGASNGLPWAGPLAGPAAPGGPGGAPTAAPTGGPSAASETAAAPLADPGAPAGATPAGAAPAGGSAGGPAPGATAPGGAAAGAGGSGGGPTLSGRGGAPTLPTLPGSTLPPVIPPIAAPDTTLPPLTTPPPVLPGAVAAPRGGVGTSGVGSSGVAARAGGLPGLVAPPAAWAIPQAAQPVQPAATPTAGQAPTAPADAARAVPPGSTPAGAGAVPPMAPPMAGATGGGGRPGPGTSRHQPVGRGRGPNPTPGVPALLRGRAAADPAARFTTAPRRAPEAAPAPHVPAEDLWQVEEPAAPVVGEARVHRRPAR